MDSEQDRITHYKIVIRVYMRQKRNARYCLLIIDAGDDSGGSFQAGISFAGARSAGKKRLGNSLAMIGPPS